MSTTYDESQHNRSGDGKFATKDGNRASAGQVDAFGDVGAEYEVPQGREALDAHHAQHAAKIQHFVDAGLMRRNEHRSDSRPGISVDYFQTERHELGVDSQGNRLLARVVSQHEKFDDDRVRTSQLDEANERWTSGVEFDTMKAGETDVRMAQPVLPEWMNDEQLAMVPDSLRELDAKTDSQETSGTPEQERSAARIRAKHPEMDSVEQDSHVLRYVRDDRGHRYGSSNLYNPMDPQLVEQALNDVTSKPSASKEAWR